MATKKETDKKVVEKAGHKDGEKTDKKSKKASGTTKKFTAKKPAAKESADKKVAAKKTSTKKPAAKKASKEEFPKEKASKEEAPAPVSPTKKDSKSKALTATQKKEIESFIESLSNPSRRRRQEAAHKIAEIAQTTPEAFEGRVEDLIDALYRPEAQTRWEILAALASLSESYGNEVIKAFDGAEASLFDDTSSTVRLAAFLFLTRYGATSQKHSDQAWPLLNEAIQCYHGDAEYYDMLVGTLNFAKGAISKETKAALKERFAFDAENATGYIQKFSAEIVAAAQ
ncbi:HEAT repeat domain-containing protein [Lancefieldella rimae]|uniref:HEAT repeat domain-containing protein n=1 Tax=Lancefieldella rimae TaxID=1383 RepID=UPI001CAC5731|nr:hypothetical protein [Lancefieldella rimae]MBF4803977.1 hypothetical protein [Lancefieldella rimae]